jgi:uncharacterized protein
VKRIVLDTNVVVSGLLWGGAPNSLMVMARAGTIQLFTSPKLIAELSRILGALKFNPKFNGIGQSPDDMLFGYALLADTIECLPLPTPIAPDPDDDWVIATAVAAQADYIVTGDKPLLSVGAVGAIHIITVGDALALL